MEEKEDRPKSSVGEDDQSQKKRPSPYDLNPNDNPGSVIVQVQLRGENYDEWARAMKTYLRARRK